MFLCYWYTCVILQLRSCRGRFRKVQLLWVHWKPHPSHWRFLCIWTEQRFNICNVLVLLHNFQKEVAWWHLDAACAVLLMRSGITIKAFQHSDKSQLVVWPDAEVSNLLFSPILRVCCASDCQPFPPSSDVGPILVLFYCCSHFLAERCGDYIGGVPKRRPPWLVLHTEAKGRKQHIDVLGQCNALGQWRQRLKPDRLMVLLAQRFLYPTHLTLLAVWPGSSCSFHWGSDCWWSH